MEKLLRITYPTIFNMRQFKVTLVDYANPKNSMALVVMATSIGEAMRSARSGNEGYLVVDAEALTPNAA